MNTMLDNCEIVYLEDFRYTDTLQIIVYEGITSIKQESRNFGGIMMDKLFPIEKTQKSRRFKIEFLYDQIINFQIIKESYDTLDKNEINDTLGFLRVVQNSKYNDYVLLNHGWYKEIHGKEANHYRLCTGNEIIDVLSFKPPSIQALEPIDG